MPPAVLRSAVFCAGGAGAFFNFPARNGGPGDPRSSGEDATGEAEEDCWMSASTSASENLTVRDEMRMGFSSPRSTHRRTVLEETPQTLAMLMNDRSVCTPSLGSLHDDLPSESGLEPCAKEERAWCKNRPFEGYCDNHWHGRTKWGSRREVPVERDFVMVHVNAPTSSGAMGGDWTQDSFS